MGENEGFVCLLRKLAGIVLPPALIAMSGSVVRFVRLHRRERFSWGEFASGMIVSGFVGVVASCLCRGLGLSIWMESAVVAMSGYSAGQMLDFGQGALLKWLERRVR